MKKNIKNFFILKNYLNAFNKIRKCMEIHSQFKEKIY